MLLDILWNLFRKSLSNNLYQKLHRSPLGRHKGYNTIFTYKNIFEFYKSNTADFQDFKNKRILEVGCGEQFYTSYFFLNSGAESVSLVDPVFSNERSESILQDHFLQFQKLNGDTGQSKHPAIRYYSSFESINEHEQFDFIFSHYALEHFRNLDSYFEFLQNHLSKDGISCNRVDLSNHVYHLFDARPLTRFICKNVVLSHLRYSDKFYAQISDKRTWVNRLLLPAYKNLANLYKLNIKKITQNPYKPVIIHPDVLKKNPTSDISELFIDQFTIILTKQ